MITKSYSPHTHPTNRPLAVPLPRVQAGMMRARRYERCRRRWARWLQPWESGLRTINPDPRLDHYSRSLFHQLSRAAGDTRSAPVCSRLLPACSCQVWGPRSRCNRGKALWLLIPAQIGSHPFARLLLAPPPPHPPTSMTPTHNPGTFGAVLRVFCPFSMLGSRPIDRDLLVRHGRKFWYPVRSLLVHVYRLNT